MSIGPRHAHLQESRVESREQGPTLHPLRNNRQQGGEKGDTQS